MAGEHLLDGKKRLDGQLLQHDTQSFTQLAARPSVRGVVAEDRDKTRVALAKPFQDLDGGCLARSVRAEESEDLARVDLEGDVVNSLDVAITLGEAFDHYGLGRTHGTSPFDSQPCAL